MSRIVEDAPVGVEPKTVQELSDERQERMNIEYTTTYDAVLEEFEKAGRWCGGVAIHGETMRRLKKKYGQ